MIVTCPNCAKRYMLDDALLPKEGRQVRCIECRHVWHQNQELDTHQTHLPFIGFNEDVVLSIPSVRSRVSKKLWILFLGLVVLASGVIVLGRNTLVQFVPLAEPYYEFLGLPVNLAGSGLSISNATPHLHQDGLKETIMVSGDLVNNSDQVKPIPPLKIYVVGTDSHPNCSEEVQGKGCVLEHWDHRLSEQSLLPGEKIHFETAPRPKRPGTSHISIEF